MLPATQLSPFSNQLRVLLESVCLESVFEATLVRPQPQPRVRNVEDLLPVDDVPPILQLLGVILRHVLRQVAVLEVSPFDLLPGQVPRAVADPEAALARPMDQVRRSTQILSQI